MNSDIQAYLAERAAEKGMPLGDMVNALLKQEIQIIESVKSSRFLSAAETKREGLTAGTEALWKRAPDH